MISRFSCKDMKKQDSFRFHVVSGFLAMVEMLHALRSLWEALFPFALLWWNVMLCATCAKYYSWNRSRFRLQWTGQHQFSEEARGESDVEEIEAKVSLLFHQSEHVEMKSLVCDHSGPCSQASCGQKMELGSCLLQQSLLLATEDCDGDDMFLHDAHVDNIAVCTEEHYNNHVEECKPEDLIISSAHVLKAVETTLPSGASKLSFLHFCDERKMQPTGFLKAAYWVACPFLLPQKVAPLAMYDPSSASEKFLEYLLMQLNLRINGDLVDVKVSHNLYIRFSTIKEAQFQVFGISFDSRVLTRIHSKEYACLEREIAKYLTSRGCSVDDNIVQLVLSSSVNDLALTRSILSSESLEGTMDHLGLDNRRHQSSSLCSEIELKSDVGHTLDNEEDVSEDKGSRSYEGHICKCVCRSQSNIDLNENSNDENAAQRRQMDVDFGYPAYSESADREDNVLENGDEMAIFHESYIHLNDKYYDFYDRSADWDVKYGGYQEADSVYGGYYDTADGVLSDSSYFDSSFESDDAVCVNLKHDNNAGVHGKLSEEKQPHLSADTWWDEDAVLVGKQEREEDSMEQAWQVV